MPTDLAGEVASLQDRMRRVETFQNAAQVGTVVPVGGTMTQLGKATFSGGTFGFVAVWTGQLGYVTFVLSKQTSIFVVSSATWFGSGGTANYVCMRSAVTGGLGAVTPVNDVNSVPVASTLAFDTNSTSVSSATFVISQTLAAGTYYAGLQYLMQGGAVTSINFPAAFLGADSCSNVVYALG
jgi:hypothetical protein